MGEVFGVGWGAAPDRDVGEIPHERDGFDMFFGLFACAENGETGGVFACEEVGGDGAGGGGADGGYFGGIEEEEGGAVGRVEQDDDALMGG